MSDLPARLRELTAYAAAGGAPEAWLQATSKALVEALLASAELRRRADRRHLALLADVEALRAALARAERAGLRGREAVACARRQFSWNNGQWYRRLRYYRAGR